MLELLPYQGGPVCCADQPPPNPLRRRRNRDLFGGKDPRILQFETLRPLHHRPRILWMVFPFGLHSEIAALGSCCRLGLEKVNEN
jgi:hypothetical protein